MYADAEFYLDAPSLAPHYLDNWYSQLTTYINVC